MPPKLLLLLAGISMGVVCLAQESSGAAELNLVRPIGSGRIVVRVDPGAKVEAMTLYDAGTRPSVQLETADHLHVSYILFPNASGKANGDECRADLMNGLRRNIGNDMSKVKLSSAQTKTGTLSTLSYYLESMHGQSARQQNFFALLADTQTCAELHASKVGATAGDDSVFTGLLNAFTADPAYAPTYRDYARMAAIFYSGHAPQHAAPYYRNALAALPVDKPVQTERRLLTDQLVMSLGMSGQLKESRKLAEAATQSDPEYPLNYYNLACADAEQGHAKDALVHLQQAYARKANTLPGERMPDPTKDDSLQKLKGNAAFWAYATSLAQ